MAESTMTDSQRAEKEERFRYVDLEHPLMQVLFQMEIDTDKPEENHL